MGEDALDSLLAGKPRTRSRPASGLKVADILLMPEAEQSLLNWLMRNYEASAAEIAQHLVRDLSAVQATLDDLVERGLLKTLQGAIGTRYRVLLAPKSGRQMPTDVWRILESHSQHANVFISYSRRNKAFVQELHAALEATEREVWVDWENIPLASDWWEEIKIGIELADTFIFVLSPDSVQSKVCGQEIEHAVQHNKRLVPVLHMDVAPSEVHPELSRLNWIFLRANDDFNTGFKGLLAALDQDIDYVRTHTRILVRALDWDRNGRDHSYLLRGTDLQRANEYLAQGREEEPRPTALHHQYVLASAEAEAAIREAEIAQQSATLRGQRRWLEMVTATSIVAIALGLTSLGLYHQAQQSRGVAEEAQLKALTQSSEALFLSDQRFEALLTATQAGNLLQSLDPNQSNRGMRAQVMSVLQQALFWIQEKNRLEGHTGTVWQVAFNPQQDELASVSADGTLRRWQTDGTSLGVFEGRGDAILGVAYGWAGDRMAAVDADGYLYLFSAAGQPPIEWRAHEASVYGVAFAPDGRQLATASADGTVRIWDFEGNLIRTLTADASGLRFLLWPPDGDHLIAGSEQGSVYLWRPDGTLDKTWGAHPNQTVFALAVSPDGTRLASAGADGQVKLFSRETGELLQTLAAHEGAAQNVRFLPNGDQLITVGADKRARIWRLDGTLQSTLVGHTGMITALAVDASGQQVATAGGDRAVRLWALQRDRLKVLQGHKGPVHTAQISPDGQRIASGGADATVKLWSQTGALEKTLTGHTAAVTRLAFTPDGTALASASLDGTVRLWSAAGAQTQELRGHSGAVHAVAVHPDGNILASGGSDRTVRLWRTDGTLLTTLTAHRDEVLGVAFSPNGQYLVSTGRDHQVYLWSVTDILSQPPENIVPIPLADRHQGWVLDAQFSPDGDLLATASQDNTVRLWRVTNGKLVSTLTGHQDGVSAVNFSPDGKNLVTASNDNTIRIWDLKGVLLTTLSGHKRGVNDIAVSPDAQFAVSASSDGTVLIWQRQGSDNIDALLDSSCAWLTAYLRTNSKAEPRVQTLCEQRVGESAGDVP